MTQNKQKRVSKSKGIRKPYAKRACTNCKAAHAACDSERPCKRCASLGLEQECIDCERKKPSGPRKPRKKKQKENQSADATNSTTSTSTTTNNIFANAQEVPYYPNLKEYLPYIMYPPHGPATMIPMPTANGMYAANFVPLVQHPFAYIPQHQQQEHVDVAPMALGAPEVSSPNPFQLSIVAPTLQQQQQQQQQDAKRHNDQLDTSTDYYISAPSPEPISPTDALHQVTDSIPTVESPANTFDIASGMLDIPDSPSLPQAVAASPIYTTPSVGIDLQFPNNNMVERRKQQQQQQQQQDEMVMEDEHFEQSMDHSDDTVDISLITKNASLLHNQIHSDNLKLWATNQLAQAQQEQQQQNGSKTSQLVRFSAAPNGDIGMYNQQNSVSNPATSSGNVAFDVSNPHAVQELLTLLYNRQESQAQEIKELKDVIKEMQKMLITQKTQ